MGAGAIVGIVLACVGLVGIIGFFAYRHFRARREDAQGYGNGDYSGQSPALESSSAQHDAKMYASMDLPKPSRQTTATATPHRTHPTPRPFLSGLRGQGPEREAADVPSSPLLSFSSLA